MTAPRRNTSHLQRRAIIVLSMHRSGSSALSGLMMRLGADGPATLLGANPENKLGHFESEKIYLMQDKLLASAGSSWDDYLPFPENWFTSPKADEFRHRLKDIVTQEYGDSGFFVLKDPRNCRLVPFWCDLLADMNIAPLFVHTHRNPLEVAHSLYRRNGFDIGYGCLIWLRSVLDAEAGSRGKPRSFTAYDKVLEDWPAQVEKIASDLGISWPKYSAAHVSDIGEIIQPNLKQNNLDDLVGGQVSAPWLNDVNDIFSRWTTEGENPNDYAALDQIRTAFTDSSQMFGKTVHSKGLTLTAERDAAQAKAAKAQADNADHMATNETLIAERDAGAAQLQLSHSKLLQRTAEIDDTRQELTDIKEQLKEVESKEADLVQKLASAQEQINALQNVGARQSRDNAKVQNLMLKYQTAAQEENTRHQSEMNDLVAQTRQMKAAAAKKKAQHNKDIADLKTQAKQAQIKTAAVLQSRSWRITAPLRWIMRKL